MYLSQLVYNGHRQSGLRSIDSNTAIALLVLLALATLMLCQIVFRPKKPEWPWSAFSKAFGTRRFPPDAMYRNTSIALCLGTFLATDDLALFKHFAKFDISLNHEGTWLTFVGPDPIKCAAQILLPWSKIRFRRHKTDSSQFVLFSDPKLGIILPRDIGEAMVKHVYR